MTRLPTAVDSDGDGVLDGNDDFPADPTRAFRTYYPSASTYGTLAFEDLWPEKGDYDLNDLVLQYQFQHVIDSQTKVKDVTAVIQIEARGAFYNNGFGFQIPGVTDTDVDSASRRVNDGASAPLQPESGQAELTWIVFENATPLAPVPPSCLFFNTEEDCPRATADSVTVDFTFTEAQSTDVIGGPPYNPFIYRSSRRGLEVHLADHPPTSLADAALLGTGDDTSNAGSGRYYKTVNNLPFALDVPVGWRFPLEKREIVRPYPRFGPWAESGGTANKNWYIQGVEEEHLY
jgi:LruC domain-containing protein